MVLVRLCSVGLEFETFFDSSNTGSLDKLWEFASALTSSKVTADVSSFACVLQAEPVLPPAEAHGVPFS